MARGVRRLTMCLGFCVAGLAVSPVMAQGEGSPPAPSSLEGSLVTTGSPTEAEQFQAHVGDGFYGSSGRSAFAKCGG